MATVAAGSETMRSIHFLGIPVLSICLLLFFASFALAVTLDGACCFHDGTCTMTEARSCADAGGSYAGDGVLCDPSPCVFGACCFGDRSCFTILEVACAGQEGAFYPGAECDSLTCPAVGACCVGSEPARCILTTGVACSAVAGRYSGDQSVCDPGPCLLNPAVPGSWGRIRLTYR